MTSVTDGDTIRVTINGKSTPVRLIGIDSPEVTDPRKPVRCFGQEASRRAHELLDGSQVWLE
ncbi:thermonuclease family protein [Arthrobacter sp. M4]|uniref:thermonuclease family protein n=1 Tax=Arthrobacter sp. M4 TaxID=218160 RepID=UPI0027E1FCD4|nr:thermonuclease family protein [Arthrobacter sp. M4]